MSVVSICIATCDRNKMLQRCLESVATAKKSKDYDYVVIVIDNNSVASAEFVVSSFSSRLNIVYEWEPTPGIPFARNRALKCALGVASDFIIFIDDDEWVESDWLLNLVSCVDKEGVDVVSGMVNQVCNGVARAKTVLKDGAIRDRAETDNVIFKSWIAEKISFDEGFSQTGGSDTLFFRTAVEMGAKIKFCSTAVVTEELPENRQRFKWRLQRQFRYGLMHCKIKRKLSDGASPVFLICRALLILPLGVLEAVVKLLFRGVEGAKEGLDRSMRGLGSLCYFLGIRYSEYKRK
ncbi:MAG: glycosyltransferase family 2 protein [Gammaproteobacteria bacterium]|nr:glycosyltransferase family 2 protein [Gammaproteobacteria bacterium]